MKHLGPYKNTACILGMIKNSVIIAGFWIFRFPFKIY